MKACPNKNLAEWKALEETFGPTQAMMAYVRSDSNIPTVDEAYDLLDYDKRTVNTANTVYIEAPGPTEDLYLVRNPAPNNNIEAFQSNGKENATELNKELPPVAQVSIAEDAIEDMLVNFEQFFPDLAYLSLNQRRAMAINVANGSIKIMCGL